MKSKPLISDVEPLSYREETLHKGLLNEDLQALVSKIDILRSFRVTTQDILLAEQIAETINSEEAVKIKSKIEPIKIVVRA